MQISTRPEIRKGCVWEVQVNFSEPVGSMIKEFYPSKVTNSFPYLILMAKSKLLKTEIPFSKVGQLLNEKVIKIDKTNTVVLHMKFTARPRAVFQKHSDVMILVATIKKGEQTLCAAEVELIFRGGTGSAHSAENSRRPSKVKVPFDNNNNNNNNKNGESQIIAPIQQNPANSPPPPNLLIPPPMGMLHPGILPPPHHLQFLQPPLMGGPPPPLNIQFQPQSRYQSDMERFCRDYNNFQPRIEQYDEQELWADFLQNKGSINTSSIQQSFDELIKSDIWNESLPFFQSSAQEENEENDNNNNNNNTNNNNTNNNNTNNNNTNNNNTNNNNTNNNTNNYRTQEDEIEIDIEILDKDENTKTKEIKEKIDGKNQESQQPENEKKRKVEQSTETNGNKKNKYETTFQKMFFLCLHFMTLPQIAAVCSTAPLPIFVKDSNSIFIYINPAFCNFIMGVAGVEMVLNKTSVVDVLESQQEASSVIDSDKWLLTQEEGSIKTFNTIVYQKIYSILKQWVTLPDGQRVFIGVVTEANS